MATGIAIIIAMIITGTDILTPTITIMSRMSIESVRDKISNDSLMRSPCTGPALLRLLTWLSPAFPLGTFSYSHGLETAISEGICHNRDSVGDWIDHLLTMGSARSDAILLAHAWRIGADDMDALISLNDLAVALCASKERYVEATQQGMAFFKASAAWPIGLHDKLKDTAADALALPVIMGATAREHGIDLPVILPASLHAFASNLISVGMRLVPLGQSDGLMLQARLEPTLLETAEQAASASLEDLGSSCFHSDIAAMRHETLYTRIFRS